MTGRFEAEFEQLWSHTSGKVRAYMFCACRNRADANDLVQDCYLRALRGWGQFNGRSSRQAWLFGIARRTRADWFRRKGRRVKTVALDTANEPAEDLRNSPADRLEQVWRSLRNLDDKLGEVIQLRFAAGLSYAEIAHALGTPIGTVRSRLHRALRAIRKDIEGQNNGS